MMAWSAAVHAQISGPLDVTALPLPHASCPGVVNAVPNDMTLDTPAFVCAIALIPASGGEVFIPAGKYRLDDTLSITNKPIAFRGEGQRITNLIWSATGASGNGIQFFSTSGPVNHTLTIKSMSLLRSVGTGGTAIVGVWQTPATQSSFGGTSATIFDVHISTDPWGQEGQPTIYWRNGIYLENAVGARIHVFNIHGWCCPDQVEAAIHIAGKSIGVSINDGDTGRWTYGIIVSGESQATRIENVETSEHKVAFWIVTSGRPHVVANCHGGIIFQDGILVTNGADVTLTDNLFFGAAEGFTGIRIVNPHLVGTGFQVRNNRIHAFFTSNQHGIRLDGPISDSVVMGNETHVNANAIVLTGGVTHTTVAGNRRFGLPIVDTCACNLLVDNP